MPRAKSTPVTHPCQQCGATFAHHKGKPNHYCSPACSHLARRKPIQPRDCQRCGTAFVPTDNRVRFCSRVCANSSHPYPPLAKRAWPKVDKNAGEDACWPWTGAKNADGYGQCKVDGVQVGAHRVIWELTYGPIPDGLMVLHDCDARYPADDKTYRCCCNPDHLFLGTHEDNMRDMAEKGRGMIGERNAHITHPESFGPQWRKRLANRSYDNQRGSAHPFAKLTEDQVREIRQRYQEGETPTSIAKDFGVTDGAVGNIAARRGWRHVA